MLRLKNSQLLIMHSYDFVSNDSVTAQIMIKRQNLSDKEIKLKFGVSEYIEIKLNALICVLEGFAN
jgi:hypothetical protein